MHRGTSPASLARGSLWMLVAGLLFSAMGVLVKLGAREFSAAELVFYRSLFGFVAILPAIIRQRGFMTPYWRWHLSRSLLGTAGISLHFFRDLLGRVARSGGVAWPGVDRGQRGHGHLGTEPSDNRSAGGNRPEGRKPCLRSWPSPRRSI